MKNEKMETPMNALTIPKTKRYTIHLIILLFVLSLGISTSVLAKGQAYVPPKHQSDYSCK